MEAVRILEHSDDIVWSYDNGADVLYLSVKAPRPAVGMDIGEGLVVRYDEASREVVGLTVVGLKARLQQQLETP